jgi:hypothetical protein
VLFAYRFLPSESPLPNDQVLAVERVYTIANFYSSADAFTDAAVYAHGFLYEDSGPFEIERACEIGKFGGVARAGIDAGVRGHATAREIANTDRDRRVEIFYRPIGLGHVTGNFGDSRQLPTSEIGRTRGFFHSAAFGRLHFFDAAAADGVRRALERFP